MSHLLIQGDARRIPLADGSVHCCVTSPPYFSLRDYGTAKWLGGDPGCEHKKPGATKIFGNPEFNENRPSREQTDTVGYRDLCGKCGATRVDSQLGLEATPDLFVAAMVRVFREVWRVLRDDGTAWVNLGDLYVSTSGLGQGRNRDGGDGFAPARANYGQLSGMKLGREYKPKDLCGIPWRVAFALQADGWYLRSDIIYAKPNPMPESVTDRPTKSHEYIFLLSKRERYFFDGDAVREKAEYGRREQPAFRSGQQNGDGHRSLEPGTVRGFDPESGRNIRSVWTIPSESFVGAHFATFPRKLVEPCIRAGTSQKGVCPTCGKAWERVTERATLGIGYTDHTEDLTKGMSAYAPQSRKMNGETLARFRDENPSSTLGWRPTCSHGNYRLRDDLSEQELAFVKHRLSEAASSAYPLEIHTRERFDANQAMRDVQQDNSSEGSQDGENSLLLARVCQSGLEGEATSTRDGIQEGRSSAQLHGLSDRQTRVHPDLSAGPPPGGLQEGGSGTSPSVGTASRAAHKRDGSSSHQRHQRRQPDREFGGNAKSETSSRTRPGSDQETSAGIGGGSSIFERDFTPHEIPPGVIEYFEIIPFPPQPSVVFDPFAGSGTTGVVALALGRRFVGLDLSAKYLHMAERRISRPHARIARTVKHEPLPLFAGIAE